MSARNLLLVPDLASEGWPSMDRYASRLARGLIELESEFHVEVATEISGLTLDDDAKVAGRGIRISGSHRRLFPSESLVGEAVRYGRRYLAYPRKLHRMPCDLVHVLDHSYAHVLASFQCPSVITVHDLMPLLSLSRKTATLRGRVRKHFLETVLYWLRRADRYIVGTEWMKSQLSEWLERDDCIRVVPFGLDERFWEPAPEGADRELRKRWRIPRDAFVVLHVGSVDKRKNLTGVIAAVAGLRQANVNAWLLQAGGRFDGALMDDLRTQAMDRHTVQLGPTSEPDLRAAYHASDVLLFPSHYEGFGFPVIEAMASGLPVVTSGEAALAEVGGGAAVAIGGREPEPYVAALKQIAVDRRWREELVLRGKTRAREFCWSDTAKGTLEVYRQLRIADQ